MIMDPKRANFPTIDTETYNMTAVAMIADIIEFMLFDIVSRTGIEHLFQ